MVFSLSTCKSSLRKPVLLLLFILFSVTTAEAGGIVAVQSFRVKPYDEALLGFRSTCGAERVHHVVADETPDVGERLRQLKPDLILAIGSEALAKVRSYDGVPIIYAMVHNPRRIIGDDENITGVSMSIPAELQVDTLQKALPKVRRIGLLYDPEKSGAFVKKAAHYARTQGLDLVAREVRKPGDVASALSAVKGSIDAFWLLPDSTVATPDTVEYILLTLLQDKIPVQSVSEKHVEMGALLAVGLDAVAVGRHAGEMARRILSGASLRSVPRVEASATTVIVNLKVAKRLGLTIGQEILRNAKALR